MKYNFDEIIDRRGTDSLKWQRYGGRDVIPMWIADMDFASPAPVVEALKKRVDHLVFGYANAPTELYDVVIERLTRLYGWKVESEWIVWLPGLVPALHLACQAVAGRDDEIVLFSPVYPPFFTSPMAGQNLKTIPLARSNGRYTFDLEKFKSEITPKTKLLLLCNPHNPVGRAYENEELKAVTDICLENDITVCSDEIHCDLILDDKKHIPTATISKDIEQKTITLMAPSKTFNLPGLNCSFAIIPDGDMRKRLLKCAHGIVPHVNLMGYAGCYAAYTNGQEWLDDLLNYLRGNRDLMEKFIAAETPNLSMDHIEATYLAWINTSKLDTDNPAQLFEEAGVGLSNGPDFGSSEHVRLNIATPRAMLQKALERIKAAV